MSGKPSALHEFFAPVAEQATRDAYPAILEATDSDIRTRIRIGHSRTQRDGWTYETTVEVEYVGLDDAEAARRFEDLLRDARLLAIQERNVRNRLDAKGGDA